MPKKMQPKKYQIKFSTEAKDHLAYIDKKHYSLIRETIHQQLSIEPNVPTRNRKPLVRTSLYRDTWEIRFGNQNCFRVFYRFDLVELRVDVIAIGYKEGNKLSIGGKEVQL